MGNAVPISLLSESLIHLLPTRHVSRLFLSRNHPNKLLGASRTRFNTAFEWFRVSIRAKTTSTIYLSEKGKEEENLRNSPISILENGRLTLNTLDVKHRKSHRDADPKTQISKSQSGTNPPSITEGDRLGVVIRVEVSFGFERVRFGINGFVTSDTVDVGKDERPLGNSVPLIDVVFGRDVWDAGRHYRSPTTQSSEIVPLKRIRGIIPKHLLANSLDIR